MPRSYSFLIAFAASFSLLTACHGPAVIPQQASIPASLSLEVKDPFFQRFTEAVQSFHVIASGEFKPGTISIHGVPLKIEKATKFRFDLTLPIADPTHINTAGATGELWTSVPMYLAGAPLPINIKLSNGTASGECDVMHTIGIFIFNVLQNQIVDNSGGGGVHEILQAMMVESATISLRPKASVDFGKLHLNIAQDSDIRFKNLAVDSASNYEGECIANLKFEPGCGFQGEKIDFGFDGGVAQFPLHCKRFNSVLTMTMTGQTKPINLNSCIFKFGAGKKYFVKSAHVDFAFDKFNWLKKEGSTAPEMHMSTAMVMHNTNLTMKDNKLDIVANFMQGVPATLQIDRDEKGHENLFSTNGVNIADSLDIAIKRGGSNILIDLNKAAIGKVILDKAGELNLSLAECVAQLREIEWSNNKRSFKLNTGGSSTLAITKGMSMELTRDNGKTNFTLPITIKAGTAVLSGTKQKIQLDELNGNAVIVVDKDVQIDGNLDLSLAHSRLLADHSADIKVRGINLSSSSGQANLLMKQCTIIVPNAALLADFNHQLPKTKVFNINKTVVEDRKWRYKDAIVSSATVSDPKIDKLVQLPSNGCSFKAGADVLVDGTIEKGGLLSIIKKTNKWETCPWSATAHINGEGNVGYKFVPNGSLSDSTLSYDLQMKLLLPDDMDLDWSKVNDGPLSGAEKSVIINTVKKLKPIPINYTGNLKLFAKTNNSHLQALKIKDFKTKASDGNVQIDFQASSSL